MRAVRPSRSRSRPLQKDRVYLTVDFEPGRTLRYRFVSRRQITLDWDPGATGAKNRVQEHEEEMELVVAYTPIEVESYGVSTVRATVESVRAIRKGGPAGRSSGTDAVLSARGESYEIQVDPRGRIVDADGLRSLIHELGEEGVPGRHDEWGERRTRT